MSDDPCKQLALDAAAAIQRLMAEHDELLEALKTLTIGVRDLDQKTTVEAILRARALITRIEGEP